MSTQVDILNSEGQASGSVELPEDLFAIEVSEYALYRAVVAYEANQRQGTASVKTRSEIARTSKKHHRQKGTGMARRGSMRSPLVRGGGVAFGHKPRSYYEKLQK
jgi:large subunit ribosomal protein L4